MANKKCPSVGAPAWMATYADMVTLLMAAPFSRFYGKKVAEMGGCEEIIPVKEIPTRTGKLLK